MEEMTQMPGAGGAGPQGSTPGGAPPGAQVPKGGPAGSPATSAMQPKGNQQVAKAKINEAVKILSDNLGSFEYGSEEWDALESALSKLVKKFPKQESASIAPASLVNMMSKPGGG